MPELPENFYCSEQICIPPTFPYLLRQFAKAAIRSQPNDLLKWSTTYFRCLSLNIPPPVKQRLEYPVPICGKIITPGWLKALDRQFGSQERVSFRLLYDRWTGACLPYDDLIKILCLGGFKDNQQIPVRRFLSLCCAQLTETLTNTMILICEVFTEEPDGGSAMITKELFVDSYRFLANLDACEKRTVRNYYFLEKFLEDVETIMTSDKDVKMMGTVDEQTEITLDSSLEKTQRPITPQEYLTLVSESQTTIRQIDGGDTSSSCSLDEDLQLTDDIQEYLEKIDKTAIDEDQDQQHPTEKIDETTIVEEKQDEATIATTPTIITVEKSDEILKEIDDIADFEEIELDIVAGVGGKVPEKIIEACCKYFDKMASLQNGMLMPRNIRHYECPPLEIRKIET